MEEKVEQIQWKGTRIKGREKQKGRRREVWRGRKAYTKPWLNYIKKSQSNKVGLVFIYLQEKKYWRSIACNYTENMLLLVIFSLYAKKTPSKCSTEILLYLFILKYRRTTFYIMMYLLQDVLSKCFKCFLLKLVLK